MEPKRSTPPAENLRRDVRVEAALPVVVQRGKIAIPLTTSDVSFRGLYVPTNIAPALRSLLRLRFTVGARIVETHVMVVHVKVDETEAVVGMGLQFWGLSGNERTAWDAYVNSLLSDRRAAVKASRPEIVLVDAASPSVGEHPALSEPATPSGVRVVTTGRLK